MCMILLLKLLYSILGSVITSKIPDQNTLTARKFREKLTAEMLEGYVRKCRLHILSNPPLCVLVVFIK